MIAGLAHRGFKAMSLRRWEACSAMVHDGPSSLQRSSYWCIT